MLQQHPLLVGRRATLRQFISKGKILLSPRSGSSTAHEASYMSDIAGPSSEEKKWSERDINQSSVSSGEFENSLSLNML